MWILQSVPEAGLADPVTWRLPPGDAKTVGRAVHADFVLDAALVSRVHCRLTASDGGTLEVEDLRSTNGTFVNDQRVKKRTLADGDRLRVGRVELVVGRS